MGLIVTFKKVSWDITSEGGVPKIKEKFFKELSPPDPLTMFQCWVRWNGIDGGAGDSKGIFRIFAVQNSLGDQIRVPLRIAQIGVVSGASSEDYELFSGAMSGDTGSDWLRIGNWNTQDARQMRIFAEHFEIEIDNPGTAYIAGTVDVIPIGFIITA